MNIRQKDKNEKFRVEALLAGTIFLEVFLVCFLFTFFSPFVSSGIGENVTVTTSLDVGEVAPEVLNVSLDDDASNVVLTANATTIVSCIGLLRDYNNDTTFQNVTAEFFDEGTSSYGGADDNNNHYTNNSCFINTSFGSWNGVNDDDYHALGECTFAVEYYANPDTWNCTMFVEDIVDWNATHSDNITISELLSIGLPNSINYGTVNSTYVASEQVANVTNFGNVEINLSLSGYAVTEGDGYAMNCTLGNLENISIAYEKFRLNTSITGPLTLSEFEANYTNLTSTPTVKDFGLASRQNDGTNEAVNSTYWRIYVPKGVAGSCSGNILFGAVQAAE